MASLLKRRGPVPVTAGIGSVIIAMAALAGCGQAKAGGPASPASGSPASGTGAHAGRSADGSSPAGHAGAPMKPAPVCANPAAVKSVRVTRLPTMTQLGQTKPLPRKLPGITVRDPARARALARLVCGLPKMPHGVFSCPIAIGGGYQLVFMAGELRLPAVTVRASGCETVSGAGGRGTRWVARSPTFWTRLSHLTGIQAPAHAP